MDNLTHLKYHEWALDMLADVQLVLPDVRIHDMCSQDGVVDIVEETGVHECLIREEILPAVQKYYEDLHFTWVQEEDKIILSWT